MAVPEFGMVRRYRVSGNIGEIWEKGHALPFLYPNISRARSRYCFQKELEDFLSNFFLYLNFTEVEFYGIVKAAVFYESALVIFLTITGVFRIAFEVPGS